MQKITKMLGWAMLALAVVSCQKDELSSVPAGMKTVTLKANASADTKASISDSGAFAWQAGDEISVLADNNKYYVLTYKEGSHNVFEGTIPESAELDGVAVYPAIYEDGSANTSYNAATGALTFSLPASYEHQIACTNVPMVAKVAAGAARAEFKQVGALYKFTFKNVPTQVRFDVVFKGLGVTGDFAVDTQKLGEEGMVAAALAADASSKVSINSSADAAAEEMSLYVPVPTGKCTEFTINAYDVESGSDAILYSKTYNREGGYDMTRGKLFITKDILVSSVVLGEPKAAFSDVKISWAALSDAEGYAVFFDEDYTAPAAQVAKDVLTATCGNFAVKSEHSVQVAPIYNGEISLSDISAKKEFTTASIEQKLDGNVGPTQVCVNFENVGGNNGGKKNSNVYYFQLFASNDATGTPIYQGYTFDYFTQNPGASAYGGTSWLGKSGGTNFNMPTRLSIGNLQPETTYYFRMKCIASTNLWSNSQEKEVAVSNAFGESAYSELVPLTTPAKHVASANEVIFEGFDDLTMQGDWMNQAPGVTPHFSAHASNGYAGLFPLIKDEYQYPWKEEWCQDACCQTFSQAFTMLHAGMVDDNNAFIKMGNTLNGWTAVNANEIFPCFGFLRIGNEPGNDALLVTPELTTNLTDEPQVCKVSFKACVLATTPADPGRNMRVDYYIPDGEGGFTIVKGNVIELEKNYVFTDASNYTRDYSWQEVSVHVMLAKGWKVAVGKAPYSVVSRMAIDDIKIEVTPDDEYDGVLMPDEDDSDNPANYMTPSGLGYEYQPFEMENKIPITYWYGPTGAYINDEVWADMHEAGFNLALTSTIWGVSNETSEKELDLCYKYKMKYIGNSGWGLEESTKEVVYNRLESYAKKYKDADFNPYAGTYFGDEPVMGDLPGYKQGVANYHAYDEYYATKVPYVNLYPSYASPATLGATMPEYYDAWAAIPDVKILSFDSYPFNSNNVHGQMRQGTLYNYDLARTAANRHHIPFLAIMQGHQAAGTLDPREDELRWQAWMALSFGAKALSYYCYWSPALEGSYLCNTDNTKTPRWYYVKKINNFINTSGLAEKLINCHADGVIQHAATPLQLIENKTQYGPLKKVTGSDCIVGCFHDDLTGAIRFMVTHQQTTASGTQDYTVKLKFDDTVTGVQLMSTTGEKTTGTLNAGVLTLNFPDGEGYLVEVTVKE